MRNPKPRTRPGRPAQNRAFDARASIIGAACLHFGRHGIKGSNNQLIAKEAGVTAAMIHYYFPNKQALHKAVLEAGFGNLLAELPLLKTLEQWIHFFHSHLRASPWLPHVMIREVLTPSGLLRPLFLKHFAPLIVGHLRQLMAQTARSLKLPASFDTDRHVVLLMGMMVYPFMSLDIAQNLTGRTFDQRMLDGFRDDALKLFLAGIKAK
ncbi:MAG TPA: TetR/AcrR family transcriptional regulator [Candidatus Acidoferrum sp.]|nr:TetR/AcrR family transcriptional regulator [Candidatus Acidoferrum sp.]